MTDPIEQVTTRTKTRTRAAPRPPSEAQPPPKSCNEVVLVGRVSATPELRELPSGDQLVTMRVVVDRPPQKASPKAGASRSNGSQPPAPRRSVDVIDVACWTKRTRRSATALEADDGVRVEGALRRRFFAAGGSRASRYEVEASRVVRVSRAAG